MTKSATPEKRHMGKVAEVGCVICLEFYEVHTPCQVHHVAEGTSKRDDFLTAGLCIEHHTGSTGLHGMGVKDFCRLWRLDNEYKLIDLVNKFRAKKGI